MQSNAETGSLPERIPTSMAKYRVNAKSDTYFLYFSGLDIPCTAQQQRSFRI